MTIIGRLLGRTSAGATPFTPLLLSSRAQLLTSHVRRPQLKRVAPHGRQPTLTTDGPLLD